MSVDYQPMTDLGAQYEAIKGEIDRALKEVIGESGFILGKQVAELEKAISGYFGVKYGIGVASGTDALVLGLTALGIGPGDEVITTPFTFIATAEAVSRTGAVPVFCDIDERTLNINPDEIKKKITKKTKAILPVHLYGMPCDMAKIAALAETNGLKLIEDCAQSFGSEYGGKKAGALGNCGCLSFFPAKTLGCFGDGGMVITDSEEIAGKIKMLRNHGSDKKYYYAAHGFNSRLDTLQAAVLKVKLKYIDSWIQKRIEAAKLYNKLLSGISDIVVPDIPGNGTKYTFNYYTIRVKNGKRDAAVSMLAENGIASAIHYPLCLHLQETYKNLGYKTGDFPVAEKAQEEVLSLPMYPELTEEAIRRITEILRRKL